MRLAIDKVSVKVCEAAIVQRASLPGRSKVEIWVELHAENIRCDMIGPYGYCADLSRSWTAGRTPPSAAQRDLYRHECEQVEHGMVVCVESLTALDGVGEAMKLESQVLITHDVCERLDEFPWELWD